LVDFAIVRREREEEKKRKGKRESVRMAETWKTPVVRVGVAAIVIDEGSQGKAVVGVRKGSHGSGHWQFPGGHRELGESFGECAEREVLEETGLRVRAEKLVATTNDLFEAERKHYVTLFVVCRRVDQQQEPQVLEPEKCLGWSWKSWAELRGIDSQGSAGERLFLPMVNLLREYPEIEALTGASAI